MFTPWRFCFHSNSNGGMTRQWSGLLAIVCFFLLGFLLYLRYASHFVEYGSQKSPIEIHISTCFLVHFVFCCFLCFLICLFLLHFHFFRCFHFLFFSVFHVLSLFHLFFIFFNILFCSFIFICSFVFIYLHILSFLSFPACSFSWKITLPIQSICMSTHDLVLLKKKRS